MKLIIQSNGDDAFLAGIKNFPVEWVNIRLPHDFIGSSCLNPKNMPINKNKKSLKTYTQQAHQKEIKINYIIDSSCLGGKDHFPGGIKKITDTISWIAESGVDAVTIQVPYFVKLIKGYFPNLKIGITLPSMMWSNAFVKFFNDQSVDFIILPTALNRNFKALKSLIKNNKCEFWLTVNSGCLYNCVYAFDHAKFLSHLSSDVRKVKDVQYFNNACSQIKSSKFSELLKIPWIRPEDLTIYEQIGFERFVLESNSPHTSDMSKIINAYCNRKYNGDLLELLSAKGEKPLLNKKANKVYLNNNYLTGFIEKFPDIDCARIFCKECKYCDNFAKKIQRKQKNE